MLEEILYGLLFMEAMKPTKKNKKEKTEVSHKHTHYSLTVNIGTKKKRPHRR